MTLLVGGNYVVAWTQTEGANLVEVRARVFNSNGQPLSGDQDFLVNSSSAGSQYGPQFAALLDGGFVAAWHTTDEIATTKISARAFNSDGTARGEDVVVDFVARDDSSQFSLSAMGDGYVITRTSNDLSGSSVPASGMDILARVGNADGSLRPAGDYRINQALENNQGPTATATLSAGGVVALWFDPAIGRVAARVLGSTGTPLGSDIVVNTTSVNLSIASPQIYALAGGGFVAVWLNIEGFNSSDGVIRARMYSADGTALGNDFLVNTSNAAYQGIPAVAPLTGGGFVAVWRVYTAGEFDELHARVVDSSGEPVGGQDEFVIQPDRAGYSALEQIVALDNGGFAVVWHNSNSSSLSEIRVSVFTADGSLAKNAAGDELDQIQIGSADRRVIDPMIEALPEGRFVVTWSAYDLYELHYEIVDPFAPVRHPIDLDEILLTSNNVVVEMLQLASEVYGKLPALSHKHEQLYEEIGYENPIEMTSAVSARQWHLVTAGELRIPDHDFSGLGSLRYSFVGGLYSAYDTAGRGPVGLVTLDLSEANALVLTGLVDGQRTLAISFRGTDQWADWDDYINFDAHYEKFRPLLDALGDFIEQNDIQQVLVSGHSLGAGMVQAFMEEHPDGTYGADYKAFTIGSPGGDEGGLDDGRIVNLINTDDLVPNTQGPLGKGALVGLGISVAPTIGPVLLDLGVKLQTKHRDGHAVLFDSGVSEVIGTAEHSTSLYVAQLIKLLEFARDVGASSDLKNDPGIKALLAGDVAVGADGLKIGIGTALETSPEFYPLDAEFSSLISNPDSDDRFVLGTAAQNDRFSFSDKFSLNGWGPLVAAGPNSRLIDGGGSEYDLLVLPNIGREYRVREIDGFQVVDFDANLLANAENWLEVARLHRIDEIKVLNGRDYQVGPAEANVQKIIWGVVATPFPGGAKRAAATPAVETVSIDSGYDYADAGDGDGKVVGSAQSDVIFFGLGAKTINGNEGDDLILNNKTTSKALPVSLLGDTGDDSLGAGAGKDSLNGGAGSDSLDGGAGGDLMQGGAGNDRYAVDSKSDVVDEGTSGADGIDTVYSSVAFDLGSRSATRGLVENLVLVGTASLAGTGNAASNQLTGNTGRNVLTGKAGDDVLDGRDSDDTLKGDAGKDTLIGGGGKDKLTGGADADTFLFNVELSTVSNVDTVTDFKHDNDLIALDKAVFASIGSTLDTGEFYASAKATQAHDEDDRIIYDTKTGRLYFDDDGMAGHGAIWFATLTGKPKIGVGDFEIV